MFVCADPVHPLFLLKRLTNEEGNKRQKRTKAADLKITLINIENYNWFQKLKTIRYETKSLNTFEIRFEVNLNYDLKNCEDLR